MGFFPYQAADINKWDKELGGRGFFEWGIGCGKTFVGPRIVKKHYRDGWRCLIVASCSLVHDWVEACKKLDIPISKDCKNQVAICTYDSLLKAMIYKWDLVIADEAHKIKTTSSARGKRFRSIATKAKRLLMMSGTATNHRDPMELINYLWCINTPNVKTIIPGNITAFRKRYCFKERVSAVQEIYVCGKEGAQILEKAFKYYSCKRVLREENCIPELVTATVTCNSQVPLEEKKEQLEAEFGMSVSMTYDKPHITHALQMANGIDIDTEEVVNNEKFKVISEKIEEIGEEQVIVWTFWRKFSDELHKYLSNKYGTVGLINGGTSESQRQKQINSFKSGELRILIASIGSIAEGQNLQNCHIAIIANQWYDYIKDTQSIGRIERVGQKNKMLVIRVVAHGTVEEDVLDVLTQKMSLHDAHNYLEGIMQKKFGLRRVVNDSGQYKIPAGAEALEV